MNSRAKNLLAGLLLLSAVALCVLAGRMVIFNSKDYWYLAWNLALAWLPLLFSAALVGYTNKHGWLNWQGLGITLLWLGFLPNSFYIVTDFVHLQDAAARTLFYDVVLIFLFTVAGYVVGFASVYQVHKLMLTRINKASAARLIAFVFALSSFAIYLGRFLRWNTWDVVTNPAGIIFDVSDRLINPVAYEQTFWVSGLLFIVLATLYTVVWRFATVNSHTTKPKTH